MLIKQLCITQTLLAISNSVSSFHSLKCKHKSLKQWLILFTIHLLSQSCLVDANISSINISDFDTNCKMLLMDQKCVEKPWSRNWRFRALKWCTACPLFTEFKLEKVQSQNRYWFRIGYLELITSPKKNPGQFRLRYLIPVSDYCIPNYYNQRWQKCHNWVKYLGCQIEFKSMHFYCKPKAKL